MWVHDNSCFKKSLNNLNPKNKTYFEKIKHMYIGLVNI